MKKERLLPPEVLNSLPPLGATAADADPLLRVKFFYPDFDWTWYAIEFDGEDTFYGLVAGFDQELGHFTLSELLNNKGRLGLEVERDLYFQPCPLSAVKDAS